MIDKTREQPIINNENVFIKGGTMATIKDVAQRAGLSISTVSRYLNHHPYISEDKKIKIQQAMDELDYVPNSVLCNCVLTSRIRLVSLYLELRIHISRI